MPSDFDPGWDPILDPVELTYKYIWKTRGPNCGICDSMAGRVYIFDRWFSAGVLPGFHLNCDCWLELVDISTPESDLDFWGNDMLLFSDRLSLFTLFFGRWRPYNWLFTEEVLKFSVPGGTAMDAIRAMRSQSRTGFFFRAGNWDIDYYQWRMFKTFKFFRDQEKNIYSTYRKPKPKGLSPYFPWQTHRTYNIKNYKPGFTPVSIQTAREAYKVESKPGGL